MTSSSSLFCVLVQPADGLLTWQRACVDLLLGELDVTIIGAITINTADNTNAAARWLDTVTRPRTARERHFIALAETTARRTVPAGGKRAGHLLNNEDIEWIRGCKPDFVLTFDAAATLAAPSRLARAGVWQFTEGAARPGAASTPALAALTRGDTRLTLSLWAQTEAQTTPALIARGHTPTVIHSRKRSLGRLHEIAPDLLRRAVANLRAAYEPALETPADPLDTPPAESWPRFLIAMMGATGRRWLEKFWLRQRWEIGLISGRIPIPEPRQIAVARWLAGPTTGFWADPCFMADTDAPALLVEEYRDNTGQGRITRLTWAGDDTSVVPTAQTLLRLDVHLSFPRSYQHAGQRWLIPEMAGCGEQRAYNLGDDGRLTDTSVVITGLAGIDPVLFAHAGRYWAFASPAGRRANYQLDLYMADDFFGPYRAHPASPVCIDPHGGRSAGPVLHDGTRLLRFGQVFGRHYGEAIDVFEITRLTDTHYAERRVGRIRPDARTAAGMHTIDFTNDATVIDRFRLVPVWRLVLARWATRRGN